MTFPMVPHEWLVLIETLETTHRKGIKSPNFGSSRTVCGEKTQTHFRNRLYFQLYLPFFKNVKELG